MAQLRDREAAKGRGGDREGSHGSNRNLNASDGSGHDGQEDDAWPPAWLAASHMAESSRPHLICGRHTGRRGLPRLFHPLSNAFSSSPKSDFPVDQCPPHNALSALEALQTMPCFDNCHNVTSPHPSLASKNISRPGK